MAVPDTLTCTCPVCDAVLEIKEFKPEIDEPIECADCHADLDWEFDDETNALVLLDPGEDDDEEDEDMDLDDDEESNVLSDDIDGEGEDEED